ncbi:MAG: hypothetical protein VX834_13135 [Myxococcota bacterium]|nr:hypothetical protein [Myxococcota bacterium]
MKVLFYLEPHPIRASFTQHVWIGRLVAQMIQDYVLSAHGRQAADIDCRILVTRHQSRDLLREYRQITPAFIGLTREENDHIESLLGPWDAQHMESWKRLMRGTGPENEFYRALLERVRSTVFEFDTIVYWGTNGVVRKFAVEHDVLPVSMELGATRAPLLETIYFDPYGVNGDAMTQAIDLNSVPPISLDAIHGTMPVRDFGSLSQAIQDPVESQSSEAIYTNVGANVLIPMQLDDDSNILMHSEYSSMLAMLEDIVPKLTDAGYTCFVKPHPGAKHQIINQLGHAACQAFVELTEGAHWLDDVTESRRYLSLLQKMDVIVTNNSSVGFESMLLGKVVIPLGRACYTIAGVHPTLDALLDGSFDPVHYRDRLERALNILLFHYLVPRYQAFDMQTFASQLKRAKTILDQGRTAPETHAKLLLANPSSTLQDYALYRERAEIVQRYRHHNRRINEPKHGLVDKVRINAKLLRQSPDAFQAKVKNYVRKRVNRLSSSLS